MFEVPGPGGFPENPKWREYLLAFLGPIIGGGVPLGIALMIYFILLLTGQVN